LEANVFSEPAAEFAAGEMLLIELVALLVADVAFSTAAAFS